MCKVLTDWDLLQEEASFTLHIFILLFKIINPLIFESLGGTY